ncbi:MAG: N-6 DNA methylase [Allosphingosinicella sp.]
MDRTPLSLDQVAASLDWPEVAALVAPLGGGAAVLAELAREKIGRGLSHLAPSGTFRTAILTADPDAESSEALIAIVVEFTTAAGADVLRETHRLAWNFSHSPILITIEPDIVRVWTCCETPPPSDKPLDTLMVHEVPAAALVGRTDALEQQAARALHWLNLVSGEFFAQNAARFDRDGRADHLLLRNLRHIRAILAADGLADDDICHDLLARVIFVQFLFDRRDADGKPALNAESLKRLHTDGVLSEAYTTFAAILSNYDDSYRLFGWLNERFNGDLFPGKGDTAEERASGWAREQELVEARHLALLAEFIRGDLDMPTGQGCLWPVYSFDVIPLEFISSIYETFVTERAARDGIFYTPPHLVDFVLDQVLPWRGTDWNLKILDPACGSGVFLVKAFQRLVHRWKQAHPGETIKAETLRRLLTDNLLGVDKDPHAVRVACFSLYLAMCDEIEPRHYWSQIRFPPMRDKRLICSDFFATGEGFDDVASAGHYDLVVGNAPWGDGLATHLSNDWAARNDWEVANKDIGGLFLAKGARLVQTGGCVAMIQSANALLFNTNGPAIRFRRQLFGRHRVDAVFNLSALRFKVFRRKTHTTKTSIAPSCVVVMRPGPPKAQEVVLYASPKALDIQIDDFSIVIEPHHVHRLSSDVARADASIWTTLMWGTARDIQLLQKLDRFPRLASLKETEDVWVRQGVIFGDRKKHLPQFAGRRLFNATSFPETGILDLDAAAIPQIDHLEVDSRASTDFRAFSAPQLLIKQSYQSAYGRFQARMVTQNKGEGVLCSESYVSVTGPAQLIKAANLAYNSLVTTYFMQLRSGRCAAYRPEAYVHEILAVPLPPSETLSHLSPQTIDEVDQAVFAGFALKEAERILIEDMAAITIPDFRGDRPAPGAQPTRSAAGDERVLHDYCLTFCKVLKSGFGASKPLAAIIFTPPEPLPFRLIAIRLLGDNASSEGVRREDMAHAELIAELRRLAATHSGGGRLLGQRIARFYDATSGTPTIFMLKPDAIRYWTRTMALNDADQVSLDLFQWTAAARVAGD